jgi:hypothetical protein
MAGTTNLDTAAGVPAVQARRLAGLRQASLGALVMLIVQFGLGIGVNLYISLPAKGSAGDAFSNGPLLALHVVVGLLLIVTAIGLLVRAIIARHGPVIAAAAVGLLAIATAATQGFSFVSDGTNAASLTMGLATAAAMLCYVIALYLVRTPAQRSS